MIRKLTIIVVAILINGLILGGFHAWGTEVAASAAQARARADTIQTLPTINVYPSAEQLKALRRAKRPPDAARAVPTGNGAMQTLVMPYYSFADGSETARNG